MRRLLALALLSGCGRSDVYRPQKLDPCAALGMTRPCKSICGPGLEQCLNGFWENCTAPLPADPPLTFELTGTVRDFHQSFPDMEEGQGKVGDDRGLVEPALGADGEPTYAHPGPTQTVNGPSSFAQWFHDSPGVNSPSPLALAMLRTSTSPLVYSFNNSSFFPIDDQLFGDEGNSHNYHFTLELHSEVEYRGGETLAFQGDDDLLVFVAGKLAIDLGGTHRQELASIFLDQLGLAKDTAYPLDVFFAERHTSESSLRIDTTNAHFVLCPK